MKKKILGISIAVVLACAAIITGSPVTAQASVTTTECLQMTWYGGAAGKKGKAVKTNIDSATGKGTYDWKNGQLTFSHQGDENGQLNGMEGSWKQDGAEGTFVLKGNYYQKPMVGTWSSKGSKVKNKLTMAVCK